MNQKHLLRFIKSKMKKAPDEKVCYRDGHLLTLKEVFESLGFSAYELSIDTMDMHVSRTCLSMLGPVAVLTAPSSGSRRLSPCVEASSMHPGKAT